MRPSPSPFISSLETLQELLHPGEVVPERLAEVISLNPFRLPRFYASLIQPENPSCPIRLQSVPSLAELSEDGFLDPLDESDIAVTPTFFRRYPDRGVFIVSADCAMYCRFCNRRRFVGKGFDPRESREETLAYLHRERAVEEVILSGGDPFMLPVEELSEIIGRVRSIAHIKVVRLSTRIPVVFPDAIGPEHMRTIAKHQPLWIVIHINHPTELTGQFREQVKLFRKSGAVLVSQTVLLRGVNDCPHILARLFKGLVVEVVKPYYLFQLDEVRGASRFKVRIRDGLSIMAALRKSISGLAIPHYAVDISGGLGKVPLGRNYLRKREGQTLHMRNLEGEEGTYTDNGEKSRCLRCGLCGGKR